VARRRLLTHDQQRELDEIVAEICDEDVDFNFVKIDLISHFGGHVPRFDNIQMYSTVSQIMTKQCRFHMTNSC